MMVFVGCENREDLGDGSGNSVEIEIPTTGNYITFSTDIYTRADLVTTNYVEDTFGVFTYKYDPSTSWGAYRTTAKPDQGALGQDGYITAVTYDNGSYAYGEPKPWESMKYAFLAYYPYNHDSVTPSGVDVMGPPYVTYNLDQSDAANHADVITGYAANCYAAVSKNVTFRMSHRLAAVDVAAVNYYDYAYESGKDGNNPIYTTEKVTIEIESMTATFTNLKYGSAKFYIDRSIDTERTEIAAGTKPQYPIVDAGGYELQPSASSGSDFDYISVDQSTTMLFIPQEDENLAIDTDNLKVDVEVEYKKRRPDGTYLWTVVETVSETDEQGNPVVRKYMVDVPENSDTSDIDPNPDAGGTIEVEGPLFTTTQTATFDQSLQEEYRYYALLTFTSHAVSINILTAAAWDENPVDYEFD